MDITHDQVRQAARDPRLATTGGIAQDDLLAITREPLSVTER